MHDYIKAKMIHIDTDTEDPHFDHISGLISTSKAGPFTSNWDFRKLPTPPETVTYAEPFRSPGVKKIPSMTSQMARTLQSIPTPLSTESVLSNDVNQGKDASTPRRTPSIKFIDRPTAPVRTKPDSPTTSPTSPSILVKKENYFDY